MKPTLNSNNREHTVPLQRTSAAWLDEPGYGGTAQAWEAFDESIDQQLQALAARFPTPRQIPTHRPQ